MRLEPGGQRVRFRVRQQIDDLMALQITQQGAIGLPFAFGPIIDPQHPGGWAAEFWQPPDQAQ